MTTPAKRPLSPHLQVYKPQITSVLSILHRATGFFLSAGMLVLVAWLWSIAYDASYFAWWQNAFSCWVGKLFLISWTVAFYYHLGNGIRHLQWDTGSGLTNEEARHSGILVLVFAIIMSASTWYLIISKIGF